jgi:hypothetical protein
MSTPKKDRIAGRPNSKTKAKVGPLEAIVDPKFRITSEIIKTVDLGRRPELKNEIDLYTDTGHLPISR